MTLETFTNPLSCSACLVGVSKHKKHSADNKLCLPPIATFSHHCTAPASGKSRFLSRHGLATCKCQCSPADQSTSVSRHRQKRAPASSSSRNGAADFYYCSWPNCPRAASKKTFKKACHLRYHMSLHTGDSVVSCPECGRQFNRTDYLRQHMLTHSNAEPYVCQHCHRRYTHKSEASLCRKRHQASNHGKPTVMTTRPSAPGDSPSGQVKGQLSALELEEAIDRARSRPYACASCPRRYTDPSSLRKHVRSHHPESSGVQDSTASPLALVSGGQSTAADPQNSHSDSGQTAVEESPEVLVLPSVQRSAITPSMALVDVQHLVSTAVTTMTTVQEQQPDSHEVFQSLSTGEGRSGQQSVGTGQSLMRSELTDADFALPPYAYWNSPVDLCNSAMCLQTIPDRVIDISCSAKLDWNSRATDTTTGWSVNNSSTVGFQSCDQDGALDLTDAPNNYLVHFPEENEAIDLSGNESAALLPIIPAAYPIDLSSGHPFEETATPLCPASTPAASTSAYYQCSLPLSAGVNQAGPTVFASEMAELQQAGEVGMLAFSGVTPVPSHWEPEPGFSFTDLLLANGDDQLLMEATHCLPATAAIWCSQPTVATKLAGSDVPGEEPLPRALVCGGLSDEGALACAGFLPPLDLRLLL